MYIRNRGPAGLGRGGGGRPVCIYTCTYMCVCVYIYIYIYIYIFIYIDTSIHDYIQGPRSPAAAPALEGACIRLRCFVHTRSVLYIYIYIYFCFIYSLRGLFSRLAERLGWLEMAQIKLASLKLP